MRVWLYIITAVIGLLPTIASAQFGGCIDSLRISPGFPCPIEYRPVCGCNNTTYRNICEATLRYGVNTYTDGSCSGYEIDIVPTFAQSSLQFTIQQSTPRFSRMFIFDVWGRLWVEKEIAPAYWDSFSLDIAFLMYGSYIMYVYDSNGTVRVKRFVKLP